MAGPIEENLRFDLAGGGVKAQLTTGGPAGPGGLALDLELQGTPHTFVNNEIVVERTGIGTLVSVVVEQKPDSHQSDFSLLIPGLVVAFDDPEHVTVVALRTGVTDSPPGPFPPSGQYQWHTPVQLKGTVTPIRPAPPMPSWQWSAVEKVGGFLSELRVRGTCEVPRPGYVVRLRRAAGQDGDPDDLRLQLTVYEPTTTKPQPPTTIAADYVEHTCRPPGTVTILPNGVSIPVEQQEEIFAPPSGCHDWTVTLDPTSEPRVFELNVEATCPPGEEVEFQPPSSRPPGANPDHLWLKQTPRRSTTVTGQTPSPVRVRYRRRTRVAYTRVIILHGGPCLPVTRHPSIPDQ
jgi:hypothetical protein